MKLFRREDDYTAIAKIILRGVGGRDNVVSVDNCITRLRLELKDVSLFDEGVIRRAGVSGVIRPYKESIHLIIGAQVGHIADEFRKLCR